MPDNEESTADRILRNHLIRLHNEHDLKGNVTARGKLAGLRYAMRDQLHAAYPIGRVFPALTPGGLTEDLERNEWRTVVAGLFAYAHDHVEDKNGVTLGAALRSLYEKARQRDSLEKRFMTLLNADAEHLPGHLRQAVSLLKAEDIGLDWGLLLHDVATWNHPERYIQKKWVHHYYRSRSADAAAEAAVETSTDPSDPVNDPV